MKIEDKVPNTTPKIIRETLAAGRQVLYLLPEIALTTQITTRLARVFGGEMAVYHSKFPDAERVELWQRQLGPKAAGLVLGVRSAVFLPFRRLGLVIVDEEHETSFKQQDPAPRYQGRDTAIVLAAQAGAKVVLGTATPSLETYRHALEAAKKRLYRHAKKVTLVHDNFENVGAILTALGLDRIDGMLFDLGVSSPAARSYSRRSGGSR